MGKQNLTLELILNHVLMLGNEVLGAALQTSLADFRARCVRIKQRRNKRIAHYDLNTLLNGQASPLPEASREEIEKALLALREFMDKSKGTTWIAQPPTHTSILGGKVGMDYFAC